MKLFTSLSFFGILPKSAVLVSTALLAAGSAGAQVLLAPTGTIYESSQNTTRTATNLFAGTAVIGQAQPNLSTTGFFAGRAGVNGDKSPIVAFDLGSVFTVTGLGYAQNVLGNPGGADKVAFIDVYAMDATQYDAYVAATAFQVAPAANSGATSGTTISLSPPGAFLSMQTVSVTNISADGVFTQYDFSEAMTGQYYAVHFFGVAAGAGSGGFPGGQELRLISAVPEPSTWAMLTAGAGLLGMTLFFRRGSRA